MKRFLYLFILLLITQFTYANEQEEAIFECERADAAAKQFYIANNIHHEDFSGICKLTSRSKIQWECVTQSIKNGNAPTFSYDQCFRTDPKTIRIGENEEKLAISLCNQAEEVAKHNNNDFQPIGCAINQMTHNSEEWLCMKKMLVNGNDFGFAADQCLINSDAQQNILSVGAKYS